MPRLGELAQKVRSKNAGPFWLTIDIFFSDRKAFVAAAAALASARVAELMGCEVSAMRRHDIEDLNVIKFSLPRPTVQGAVADRDQHGASWAQLVAELEIGEVG